MNAKYIVTSDCDVGKPSFRNQRTTADSVRGTSD